MCRKPPGYGRRVPLRNWTTGVASDLPPVLLVHGGPGLWDYLAPVATLLEPLTTVHRFDQRDSGEHTFARYLADIEELRVGWGHDDWVVIGHSFGATLALAYAMEHPGRTRALGYLAGVGVGDWRTPSRAERARRMTRAQRDRLADLERSGERSRDEELEFRALSWFTDFADPVDGWRWALEGARVDRPINWVANRALMAETDTWADEDVLARASRLTMPCWFLHGDQDPRPAHTVARLASAVPGARFRMIAGAGHHPWRERPAELGELLRALLA